MNQNILRRLVGAALVVAGVALAPGLAAQGAATRNVILIIGDGMDEQQTTIARNYLKGARGKLLMDQMPFRGISQVLTIEDAEEERPVYVADSANTATSMATGVVTSRGRIATSAGTDKDLTTITELASTAGYRTGIVTTANVTDATPSSFAAHISFRLCENPTLMEEVVIRDIHLGSCSADMKANGGPGSISEQLAESKVDVILGGGVKHFTPNAEGRDISVEEVARENGFRVVMSPGELAAAEPGQRLLGLFSKSTMPVRLRGQDGRTAEAPEPSLLNHVHRYLGDVELPAVMKCEPNPDFQGMPTLRQMTDAALANLTHENERGFFLMIESASIDKEAHYRRPCGSIGEVEQLEEALASALAFAQKNPNTLVLVTSDHSQAAQLIPNKSLFASYPVPTYSPGQIARIETPEGSIMVVNYATTNFMMAEHTGAAVPLYSNEQGRELLTPFIQQPQIFEITRAYLGL